MLCALCRPHFLTDFFQILYRYASYSNLHTYSFWWCCPQCSVFYRVKGHILVHILVCALTAAYFSGYLSCERSAGHISWQISFECCIEVHYRPTLIYTHMILEMLLLVLTIVRGTGGDLYVILLFEGRGGGGGEVLCPSFEQKDDTTRLILFSNSEPSRLCDVVSHLITIETTINTHTHTHTHARTHTHTHTHTHARTHTHTHTHTYTHTYRQFTNQQQYICYFVHVGLSAATHRQFFLRQNIFRAFKNNDQIPDTFRILEKYTEKYTNLINNQKTKLSKLTFRESSKILITSHQDLTRTKNLPPHVAHTKFVHESTEKNVGYVIHYWSIILACVRRRHFGSVTITFYSLKFSPQKYFES